MDVSRLQYDERCHADARRQLAIARHVGLSSSVQVALAMARRGPALEQFHRDESLSPSRPGSTLMILRWVQDATASRSMTTACRIAAGLGSDDLGAILRSALVVRFVGLAGRSLRSGTIQYCR